MFIGTTRSSTTQHMWPSTMSILFQCTTRVSLIITFKFTFFFIFIRTTITCPQCQTETPRDQVTCLYLLSVEYIVLLLR